MPFIPIYAPATDLFVGEHRLCFKEVNDFDALPVDFQAIGGEPMGEVNINLLFKQITLQRIEKDFVGKNYYVYFNIIENPLPAGAVAIGIIVIIGLSLSIMVFDRVERVIETSGIGELIATMAQSPVIVLLVVAIIGWYVFKKYR